MRTPEPDTTRRLTDAGRDETPANGAGPGPALRPFAILRAALGTYRRRPLHVIGTAAVIFAPLAVADVVVSKLAESTLDEAGPVLGVAFLVSALALTSSELIALEFYAGLLDRVVGEDQHGHPSYTIAQVVRTLPYRRLILASLLVWAIASIGTALLVLPGLIAFTYLSISGPVINIEGRGVIDGLRRSVALVRGRFWLVFACITVPLAFEETILEFLHDIAWFHTSVGAFLLEVASALTLGAIIALSEVTVAHALIARDRRQDAVHLRRNP